MMFRESASGIRGFRKSEANLSMLGTAHAVPSLQSYPANLVKVGNQFSEVDNDKIIKCFGFASPIPLKI